MITPKIDSDTGTDAEVPSKIENSIRTEANRLESNQKDNDDALRQENNGENYYLDDDDMDPDAKWPPIESCPEDDDMADTGEDEKCIQPYHVIRYGYMQ